MNIPFVDLKTQYRNIKKEIDAAIQSVIDDTAFIRGKFVADFETAYRAAYGVKHCISVANGTDALYITLKMLGLGAGDEVITVANSWISTSETITQTGARVVFVDCEPDFFTIDPQKIESKITAKTKALIPVHLFGQPADMDPIVALCKKYKLFLIEDCAQAHFAEYNGKKVGTFGDAGTFSFYPGKNLGAYGDGGAIITNDDALAEKMRMYANHGSRKKHAHDMEGINSRLDGLQAAILSVKLNYIHAWNAQRYHHARVYQTLLGDIPQLVTPAIRKECSHIFHLYVVRVLQRRDELMQYLKEQGIETALHYPQALPFVTAYQYLQHTKKDFPVAAHYQKEILSLPMFPELTTTQIETVAGTIRTFFTKGDTV